MIKKRNENRQLSRKVQKEEAVRPNLRGLFEERGNRIAKEEKGLEKNPKRMLNLAHGRVCLEEYI